MDKKSEAKAAKLAAKELAQQEKAAKRAATAQLKEVARAEKAEKLQALQAAKRAEEKANLEKYGRMATSELIQNGSWLSRVSIYDKGYVKIGGRYEKIRGVTGDVQVSKKTGLGRGVVAVATFGVNLALSNSQRGRIHLTIVTNVKTHTFSTDQVSDSAIRSYQNLLATGTAILETLKAESQSTDAAPTGQDDLAAKITQLAELHKQGVLNDEEFSAAKAKLLGS